MADLHVLDRTLKNMYSSIVTTNETKVPVAKDEPEEDEADPDEVDDDIHDDDPHLHHHSLHGHSSILPLPGTKRKSFTVKEKLFIVKKSRRAGVRLTDLAFSYGIGVRNITRWRKQEEKLREAMTKGKASLKRNFESQFPVLEDRLLNFFAAARARVPPLTVTIEVVRVAVDRFKSEILENPYGATEAEKNRLKTFNCSSGWVSKFMARNGLSSKSQQRMAENNANSGSKTGEGDGLDDDDDEEDEEIPHIIDFSEAERCLNTLDQMISGHPQFHPLTEQLRTIRVGLFGHRRGRKVSKKASSGAKVRPSKKRKTSAASAPATLPLPRPAPAPASGKGSSPMNPAKTPSPTPAKGPSPIKDPAPVSMKDPTPVPLKDPASVKDSSPRGNSLGTSPTSENNVDTLQTGNNVKTSPSPTGDGDGDGDGTPATKINPAPSPTGQTKEGATSAQRGAAQETQGVTPGPGTNPVSVPTQLRGTVMPGPIGAPGPAPPPTTNGGLLPALNGAGPVGPLQVPTMGGSAPVAPQQNLGSLPSVNLPGPVPGPIPGLRVPPLPMVGGQGPSVGGTTDTLAAAVAAAAAAAGVGNHLSGSAFSM